MYFDWHSVASLRNTPAYDQLNGHDLCQHPRDVSISNNQNYCGSLVCIFR